MRGVKLLIAYDGSNYSGWQRQRNACTVQEILETGLTTITREHTTIHGAGRTDAGVHALGMVAHFHTHSAAPLTAFFKGLNSMIPKDIRVLDAQEVDLAFHSRFSAQGKTYRYDFFSGDIQMPSRRLYQAHLPGPFNLERVTESLRQLTGTHDFSSFERSGSRDKTLPGGRGAVRTLYNVTCSPRPGCSSSWSFKLTGDGFLRQMVRNIVGILIEIGMAKRPGNTLDAVLAAKDRSRAGLSAPACGLYLEKVFYHKIT